MATQPSELGVIYMLEVMEDIWDRLNTLFRHELSGIIEHRLLSETEQIVLRSERELYQLESHALEAHSKGFRKQLTQLTQPTMFGSSEAAEHCAHRFLSRSCKCLHTFVEFYLRQLGEPNLIDKHSTMVQGQLEQIQDTTQRLIVGKLDLSPDRRVDCPPQLGECINSETHFHSIDGLTWLNNQWSPEREISLPSETTITWRDFDLVILKYDPRDTGCLDSLAQAAERSIEHHTGEGVSYCASWWRDGRYIREFDNEVDIETLPVALSFVTGLILTQIEAFSGHCNTFQLGIILPGGSQVFWPKKIDPKYDRDMDNVYVKAHYIAEDGKRKLRFLPVETKERSKDAQLIQTVKFLALPAEVRNMIYGYMLDQEGYVSVPDRQPRMALTCQLVNQEIMSLLFERCGWLVKI